MAEEIKKALEKDSDAKEKINEKEVQGAKAEAEINEEMKTKEQIEETEKEDKNKEKVVEAPRRRRRKTQEEITAEQVAAWKPVTKLGKMVREKKITNIDEILNKEIKILESEIVDSLIKVDHDLLFAGQSKGKFGGGKRRAWRQAQKKTKEGNKITFSALVIVGDKNGHVGVGFGKAGETLPAREKALRKAKLNIMKVKRGSGSFEGSSTEPHSIPFKVEGKCGSCKIKLIPAPQGTGLVIGNEGKKILKLAGIQDIYSQFKGQSRTTLNYAKAIIDALGKLK